MKKMKKWLALGLAAAMVLSMTACGSSGGGDAAGDTGSDGGRKAAVRTARQRSPWRYGTEAGVRTCRPFRRISTAKILILIWISRCRQVTIPISSAQR